MARIESWFEQDLQKPITVRYLGGNVFSQDNLGNLIGVVLTNNGADYSGGGSVSGSVIRNDGGTVALTGAIDGNRAYVVLPQAAYAVVGTVTIIIKLTVGSEVATIAAIVSDVYASSTDVIIDPSTIIPSIAELIAEIDEAVDSIPLDWSELNQQFGEAKSAIAGAVDSLYTYDIGLTWYQGSIKANGTNASNTACCRTDMIHLGEYQEALFKPSTFQFYIVEYSSNTVSNFTRIITPVYTSGNYAFAPVSGYYYRIVVKKQDGSDFTPSEAGLANVKLSASANCNDIILNIKDGIAIQENDDLDDYTIPGRYISRNTAITETLSHCPIDNTGFDLFVTITSDRDPGEYIRHILIKNDRTDNAIYIRYKGASWGEWETIHDSNWPYLLNTNITAEIPSNADLDSYTTPGRYSAANTAITKTLENSPIPDTGFDLFVTVTSGHAQGTYIRQILIKNSKTDNSIFIRYLGLTWGEWQRINMASSKLTPIQVNDVPVRVLSARNTNPAKLTINVGTFNVARYNHDTDVYLEDEPQLLLNIRNWLNDNNLDILFTQEDTGYINLAKSKTSYDYLFKGFFNADPVNTGDSTDVARANKKIFTTLPINTNGTVVHLDNNANPPAVYPSGHIYEGQTITAYFVWVKQTIPDVGTVMLIDLHNFYNGAKNSHTEWHPYQNRVLFLNLISTFLASQEYDYCIIAGDFNASNKDGKNASGSNVPIDGDPYGDWNAIQAFCANNHLIPCNGGRLEWFKTNGSSALDNILVSENIRIEKVECEPDIRESLYSDHAPIIARISFT